MIDPVLASRLQFAWTTAVHIIFPAISMGLAPFLVYFAWKEMRGAGEPWVSLRRFWVKIFALTFVVGTVTGIVLEFEFGTNFAAYASIVGGIFGGPLATEGLMAFMLESTFLGILLFGKERVSKRLYFLSAVLVALGSWLSAVWILIANSWMQLPRGFEMGTRAGQEVAVIVDPIAAYLNPRFFFMFTHMQASAVLSAALFMAGIAMYKLTTTESRRQFWMTSLKLAIVGMLITAPFMAVQGDAYGRHVYETQPQKFAAMEAVYETESGVSEYLFAVPTDPADLRNPSARNLFAIGIPGGASFLASGGDPDATIKGLDDMESLEGVEGEPPVAIVFWSFRLMVGLGVWFILLAFWSGFRWYQDRLLKDQYLQKALMLSIPLGVLALEFGWIVTEVGRQPWAIQEVLTVAAGVSPGLTGGEALLTLVGFVGGYTALFAVWAYLVRRLIIRGPKEPATEDEAEVVPE
ncbi:cytochrome ubiquinol oxidase subunit I [Halodesulfurarchaeum sp.]|uniref:cytochrome ubiquinol oxidase subunit I n=1 Tax=Halodesulfurarchaeum sp. TaxID=1980530 RepID=UPI001BC420D5|nr:cytochrome ubiquinol oxidase subunit I [Halodesulfurarchaeum sp.]